MVLYIGNDILISLSGTGKLLDRNGDPVTGATVQATIKNLQGEEISGVDWPVDLDEGDDGEYSAVIQSDVSLSNGGIYKVEITAKKGDADAKWIQQVSAQHRIFNTE